MARLIRSNGTVEQVAPQGRAWKLAEVQQHVGGSVELTPASDWGMSHKLRMLTNEEGRLRNLPPNAVATEVLHQAIATHLNCSVADLPREVGKRLRYLPMLVGDVLVLDQLEKF